LSLGEGSSTPRGDVTIDDFRGTINRRKQLTTIKLTLKIRKHGERIGLDTQVVHALTDEC
jgi:hypothetical protein